MAVVKVNGTTTAVIQSATVAVSHLLTSTLARDTGFEIVHANVPLSRSAMRRLIVAKITARTMNCVPTADSRLSSGCIERTLAGSPPGSAGVRRTASSLIQALAAASAKTAVVTARTIHDRLPWTHSETSLRTRLRRPRNPARLRPAGLTADG